MFRRLMRKMKYNDLLLLYIAVMVTVLVFGVPWEWFS